MYKYKKVLIAAYDINKSKEALTKIQTILSKSDVIFETFLPGSKLKDEKSFDLILVVGGDGSMLSAAKSFNNLQIPFLGINLGKVGFMADLEYGDVDSALIEVLKGECQIEQREFLECEYGGKSFSAFNEIVLHTQKSYKLIEFEVKIDQNFVYNKRADGLIISTATGSTAYSLSAGGPILTPLLEAFVITSLNPLSLSARPLIIPSDSKISVEVVDNPEDTECFIILDGNQEIPLKGDSRIFYAHKSQSQFKLIHPKEHDFFEACRGKLNWSISQEGK